MNSKTMKLIRKLARTPEFNKGKGNSGHITTYGWIGTTKWMKDCHRLTAKTLKKLTKAGKFSAADLRKEVELIQNG